MVSHFLFEAEFCNPASGWEKGQVEKNVRDARHRLWQVVPPFASLPDLNAWLEERCVALWNEIEHGKLPGTVADVWAQEKTALMPMPRPFDGFVEHTKRVSPTCLIHFERNRYSVPAPYANRPVSLRVYADRLVVAAEGQIVCEHQRLIERNHRGAGQTVYDWRHYLAVLQRKPGALRNGAPFLELPPVFKRLQAALVKQPGGDREIVEILGAAPRRAGRARRSGTGLGVRCCQQDTHPERAAPLAGRQARSSTGHIAPGSQAGGGTPGQRASL
jgi:hypothetical protein